MSAGTPTQTRPPQDAGGGPSRPHASLVALLVTVVGAAVLLLAVGQATIAAIAGAGREGNAHYEAAVSGVTQLDIDVSGSSLTVRFDDVPEATLDVESTGWRADTDWTFEVNQGVLEVSDHHDIFFWSDWGTRQVDAVLVLPSELEAEVDADLALSAGDLSVTGDLRSVDMEVSAGSLTFSGASTSLGVDVSAGDATITTTGPQDVAISVSAGRLVGSVSGEPPATTSMEVSAGSAILDLPEAEYALSGEVSAGDREISVRTDPSSPYSLDVDVSAGSVEIGYSN